jgi:hypothetical protein
MPAETGVRRDFSLGFSDLRRILVRIGYRKGTVPDDDPILTVVREEARRAEGLIAPASAWAVIEPEETTGHAVFAGARRVALCVCTIGPGLEAAAAEDFRRNDDLRGMVLDALGSDAVGRLSRMADRFLAEKALAQGLWPSKRYAPGYKGWDVCEQAFLFSMVPAAEIGVRLTESFMMVPRKSYSFRLNFYAEPSLSTRGYPPP